MNSLGAWEETEEYRSPRAGTVYRAPKPQPTAGDKLRKEGVGEDGGYIDSGELAPDGTIQESRMFDIDPKKHKTQQKQKKIRNIAEQGATEGEQAAGKRKLKDQTDLPQFLQSAEMDEIYAKDKAENLNKDRAIEASGKAWEKGNTTARERIDQLLNAPKAQQAATFASNVWEDAKKWRPMYDVGGNLGALGVRAIDSAVPRNWKELQQELVELKASRAAYPALKLIKEIPTVQRGLTKLDKVVDEAFSEVFSIFNINTNAKKLAGSTGSGSIPLDNNVMMSKQTDRMAGGFKENIDRIPKKNTATDFELIGSDVDTFAKVNKPKLKKYVKQFGGTDADLEGIFKEYTTKHNSALNAKAWLNKYWKDLNKGIGQGGLKNARIKAVDGKLKIVDGRTKKTLEHPFELDHSKAKELMNDLGLEGADMSDNLEIVYSEWNRAKNNIGNPAIPDEIAEAIGQSTTLENFVRRRLDETFKLQGERVPQRFKEAAKVQMLDDAQNLKPNEKLADVIEKRLKLYDRISDFMVQIDDYVPKNVQRQFDKARDLNPQEYLQDLKDRGIYDRLTGSLKKLHDKLSDDWINMKRGLRSRPTTKYMKPGHDV